MKGDPQKIEFPCRWEYRLISSAGEVDLTRAAVNAIGSAENVSFDIADGGSSGGGKYCALRISCTVDSLEEARALAGKLGSAEGVKFIL